MSNQTRKLTKRQQRLAEKGNLKSIPTISKQHFNLKEIFPKTENQEKVFDLYEEGNHIMLHGCPGTGKTFLAMYLALKEILSLRSERNRLVIIRSVQQSKNMGFLPGDEKEKASVFESPYRSICSELFGRDDAYDILKTKGIIEFQSTSFLRGCTIDNAIILVEECQNMSDVEQLTVLSRTGDDSRVIISGDEKQDDLTSARYNEESGIKNLLKILDFMRCVEFVDFSIDDIVRSGFVKELMIARYKLGL